MSIPLDEAERNWLEHLRQDKHARRRGSRWVDRAATPAFLLFVAMALCLVLRLGYALLFEMPRNLPAQAAFAAQEVLR